MPRLHSPQKAPAWQSTNCLLVMCKPVAARQRTPYWLRGGALQLVEKMTWTPIPLRGHFLRLVAMPLNQWRHSPWR